MKSPWLPPGSTAEQAFASCSVVLGAIAFAAFLGLVTSLISSYDKGQVVYREHMTTLHNYCSAKNMSRPARASLLANTDAYFKTRADLHGKEERDIIAQLPRHLQLTILYDVYSELINCSPFLQGCTYSGCGAFLQALVPDVCIKGDALLTAGTTSELMYILMKGEMQLSFPEEQKGSFVTVGQMLGQSESTTTAAGKAVGAGGKFPQGRIERMGTLLGWSSPFGNLLPSSYTVRALVQSECLSISRTDFRSVLATFPGDAACFARAAEHAAKTFIPIKTLKSNSGKDAMGSLRNMGSVRAGAGSGSVRDETRSDGSESFRAPCNGASWLPPSASSDTAPSTDPGANEQDGCRTRTDTEAGSGAAKVSGGGKDESVAELRSQMDAGFSRLAEQQEKLAADLAGLKQLIVASSPS